MSATAKAYDKLLERARSATPDQREALRRQERSSGPDPIRRERWKPVLDGKNPGKFEEDMQKRGGLSVEHVSRMRNLAESCLDRMDHNFRDPANRKDIKMFSEKITAANPGLFESTDVTDIAVFRDFSFGIVREMWPKLAPLAAMIGMFSMPGPSERIFYLNTYGTDNSGTFYTGAWRMRNQVDPAYIDYTCGSEANEVELTITGANVTASAYALLARWDLCAEQDAMSQHGISLQTELQNLMASYIARATVQKVRNMIAGGASGGNAAWTATAASPYTLDSGGPKAHLKTLYDAVLDMEGLVRAKRYDNLGFLWCSPDVVRRFQKAEDFHFVPSPDFYNGDAVKTTQFAGTTGRWMVFNDDDAPANTCIGGTSPVGGISNIGLMLAMYIPLFWTGRFMDPAENVPREAGITRYALHMVDSARFGKVVIS